MWLPKYADKIAKTFRINHLIKLYIVYLENSLYFFLAFFFLHVIVKSLEQV